MNFMCVMSAGAPTVDIKPMETIPPCSLLANQVAPLMLQINELYGVISKAGSFLKQNTLTVNEVAGRRLFKRDTQHGNFQAGETSLL